MKKVVCSFVLLCLVFTVFSQSGIYSAKIITYEGDTLKGVIDVVKGLHFNPRKLKFKQENSQEYKTFTPNDIESFEFEGRIYASAIVGIDTSLFYVINRNPIGYKPDLIPDTVFLLKLIGGEKSLYSLYYQYDKRTYECFFVKDQNGPLVMLEFQFKANIITAELNLMADETYKFQLLTFFLNITELERRIINTSYTKSSLMRLFKRYYTITQKQPDYLFKQIPVTVYLGLTAGYTNSSINFTTDKKNDYLSAGALNYTSNPLTFGFCSEIMVPGLKNHLSFSLDGLWNTFKFDGNYTYTDIYDLDTRYKYNFETSHFHIALMPRYNINLKKTRIFLGAGISTGFELTTSQYMRKEQEYQFAPPRVFESKPITNTKSINLGFQLGMGCVYNRHSVELRYSTTNGVSNVGSILSTVNYINLLYSYKLFKVLIK